MTMRRNKRKKQPGKLLRFPKGRKRKFTSTTGQTMTFAVPPDMLTEMADEMGLLAGKKGALYACLAQAALIGRGYSIHLDPNDEGNREIVAAVQDDVQAVVEQVRGHDPPSPLPDWTRHVAGLVARHLIALGWGKDRKWHDPDVEVVKPANES